MNEETQQAILDEVMAEIERRPKHHFELVYVDYRDGLDRDQVSMLARGDFDSLYETTDEWVNEAAWEGARGLLEDILGDLDDWDDGVLNEWQHTNAGYQAYEEIMQRDTSTPLEDMAAHSGNVLLRVVAVDEDDAWSFEPIEPVDLLERLGLPLSEHNLREANDVIANASPEFSVCMGYWLIGVYVRDLYELQKYDENGHRSERLRVTDPGFWLGSPFMGSGWVANFEGEITVAREDLRTDHDAFGYGCEDVVGEKQAHAFNESKIIPITEEVPA